MSIPLTATAMAEQFLFQTLAQDSQIQLAVGGRISNGQAPETTAYPLIFFHFLAARTVTALGGWRTMTVLQYQVQVADNVSSLNGLDSIADRIDHLLHGGSMFFGTLGAGVIACTQMQPLESTGSDEGREYRQLGATYEIQAVDRP